jgi:tetratricopeptide (TPR) repeat protein
MARLLPIVTVFIAVFFISGCSKQDATSGNFPELYRKASFFAEKGEYEQALMLYNTALTADTSGGLSARSVQALYSKRHLEGVIGRYGEAIRTTRFLEQHARILLPDSLYVRMLVDKAMWLSELGDLRGAAKALAAIPNPGEEQRIDLAKTAFRLGDLSQAEAIYGASVLQDFDPVAKMRGLSGLLACTLSRSPSGSREADDLAIQIASISGKVLSLDGDFARRIQVLREAAGSLQMLEKHRRNASYLLFRALVLAEQSKNSFLLQLLRYESNAVIVRKPSSYRETADFFGIKNLQFAQAAALLQLGTDENDLTPAERIDVLRRGLQLYQDYQPRYPGTGMMRLERRAERMLSGMLIRQARVFELYDALQQSEMREMQRNLLYRPGYLKLGNGHESLESEVNGLQRDIAGLLQRKADMLIRGRGYELNNAAESALQAKRGRLYALLDEVRNIDPAAASVLRMTPVTLQTLQRLLKRDQLVIKPVLADSFYAVMTISSRELGIAGTPMALDSLYNPDSGLHRLHRRIASISESGIGTLRKNGDLLWFSGAAVEPVRSVMGRYEHLIVAAEPALPFQFFGVSTPSIDEKKISMTSSFREIAHAGMLGVQKKSDAPVRYFSAEKVADARMYLLFNPGHVVYLLWKPFSEAELSAVRKELSSTAQQTSLSAEGGYGMSDYGLTGSSAVLRFVSAYGTD